MRRRLDVDACIVNLETAVTAGSAQWPRKGIHDRRHPASVDVLTAVSTHWGGNWVFAVPQAQRDFARQLVDLGTSDVVHGHSAHHPLPFELHAGP